MIYFQSLVFVSYLCFISASQLAKNLKSKLDPETDMNPIEIIQHWGYPAEEYDVTTTDGYILTIQRIPHGRNSVNKPNRPVIFMQHGLECSSTNWITNLPQQSAGFLFADAGFDVWLGNFRGNTYSKRHETLSPDDSRFWKFSWDEMAQYDLEAMINKALEISGHSQLYYMGHSEGTMTAFAKFSSDLIFARKIKQFYALGPVATVKHIEGAFKYIAEFSTEIQFIAALAGYNQFLPNNKLMDLLGDYICGEVFLSPVCSNLLFLVAGTNTNQLNETRLPVYLTHTPAGTSTQNVVHFAQMVKSGKFQKYNYGYFGNAIHYNGNHQAPVYNIRNMRVPTALFWGDEDVLADPTDIKNSIIPNLRNSIGNGNFELNDFNHLDFIWGLRAAPEVYTKIIRMIKTDRNEI